MSVEDDSVADMLARVRPAHDDLDAASVRARVRKRLVGVESEATRIGRFEILSRLGAGGMGVVYEARDPRLERNVALKVIAAPDAVGADRLLAEGRALAKLSHPNVVAVYEAEALDGRVVIAMELVRGTTLTRWLGGGHSMRTIVATFVQAGEGLAAAHAAGLVHGDFKPDNVLVGDDGRVRVADFGLAKPREHAELASGSPHGGTPSYASPEQLAGARPSEASDQYSFGVALVRAIVGRVGAEVRDVRPAWLRRVLERATAATARERYGSLAELVAALRAGLARRRRALAAAAMLGALAIGGGAVYALRPARAASCDGSDAAMAAVWNPARAGELRAEFAATRLPFAPAMATRVTNRLDALATEWHAGSRAACEATRITGEQTEHQLELRTACLDDRRRRIGTLVDVWTRRPDAAAMEHALDALGDLPAIADCADASRLGAALAQPSDPVRRVIWGDLRGRLATAYGAASLDRGDPNELDAVAAAAISSGFGALAAEASVLRARIAYSREDTDAERRARAALDQAAAAGDAETVSRADILLLEVLTTSSAGGAGYDQAAALQPAVEAAARLVARPEIDAELADATARLAFAHADYDRASADDQRAIALARKLGAHAELANVEIALADVYRMQGEYAKGVEAADAAIAAWKETYGDIEHPSLGSFLDTKAELQRKLGDTAGAIANATHALALADSGAPSYLDEAQSAAEELSFAYSSAGKTREAADMALVAVQRALDRYGPRDVFVGRSKVRAAEALRGRGDLDAALVQVTSALAILRDGRDTPGALADANEALGGILLQRGDLRGAEAADREALALAESLGGDHPKVAVELSNLGEVELDQHRWADATATCTRALAIDTARLGADHPELAFELTCLGEAKLGTGDVAGARELLERAWSLRTTHDVADEDRATTAFALARTLGRADARAVKLATDAARWFSAVGQDREARAATTWLASGR